jgi:hypothetical protein
MWYKVDGRCGTRLMAISFPEISTIKTSSRQPTHHNGPPKTSLALIRNHLPKRNVFHPLFHSLTKRNNKDHPRCRPSTGCTQLWRPRGWLYGSLTLGAVFQCGDEYGGHTSVKGSLSNSMGCVDICTHDRGTGVCDYGSSGFGDGEES